MKVLYLTLKKEWFDMIAAGVKREEYRDINEYWNKRLVGKSFDAISFKNGYSPVSPQMTVELKEILTGFGLSEWGAPDYKTVYILRLGEILSKKNFHAPDEKAIPKGMKN